jgi:hypothetical protein
MIPQPHDPQPIDCFAHGTLIDTPAGPVAIEALAVGDQILAHDGDAGGALSAQPIIWIGHRSYTCAIHPDRKTVWPVRIATGALGAGLPRRDLFLSPQHAVFLHGLLIPANLLINHGSIAQVPVEQIAYYHIELTTHAIILAEGVQAESYLNTDDRGTFAECHPTARRSADFVSHLWEAAGCARLILCGPELGAARASLAAPRGRTSHRARRGRSDG